MGFSSTNWDDPSSPIDGWHFIASPITDNIAPTAVDGIVFYVNDILVEGEGELQIFDVMGRLVSTQHVTNVETIEKPSQPGIYIFKFNGKTQKIVVK